MKKILNDKTYRYCICVFCAALVLTIIFLILKFDFVIILLLGLAPMVISGYFAYCHYDKLRKQSANDRMDQISNEARAIIKNSVATEAQPSHGLPVNAPNVNTNRTINTMNHLSMQNEKLLASIDKKLKWILIAILCFVIPYLIQFIIKFFAWIELTIELQK